MDVGILWDATDMGLLRAGVCHGRGDAAGRGMPLEEGNGMGRGCVGQGMPCRGRPWQGLPAAGTSGFPPAGNLTDRARWHDVALGGQADQGHTPVQSGWPGARGAAGCGASPASSGAWQGPGMAAHLASFSITSWDSEGPQTIRTMGMVCWSGSLGPGSLKSVPSCTL